MEIILNFIDFVVTHGHYQYKDFEFNLGEV